VRAESRIGKRTGTLKTGALLLLGGVVAVLGRPATAQEPVSVEHFDGSEQWPLYEAGELELEGEALEDQRTWFDFLTPSGDTVGMTVDVHEVFHRGEPALWVQWTSKGEPGDTAGTSTIDDLLIERSTFRIAFRIQASPGPRSWAGNYDLVQHHPDRVVRVAVRDDGSVDREVLEEATAPFDFATMGYLFPLLPLDEMEGFRLLNVGTRGDISPKEVALWPAGRTTIEDSRGGQHRVQEVQLLSASGRVLVSFYVTRGPPYFWGWLYRNVEDGRVISHLVYRGHEVYRDKGPVR